MNEILEELVKKYPNDYDLGVAVRNLINNYGEDLYKMQEWRDKKNSAGSTMEYEEAGTKEKEIIKKIKKNLHLL